MNLLWFENLFLMRLWVWNAYLVLLWNRALAYPRALLPSGGPLSREFWQLTTPLNIAVNLSAEYLQLEGFVERWVECLLHHLRLLQRLMRKRVLRHQLNQHERVAQAWWGGGGKKHVKITQQTQNHWLDKYQEHVRLNVIQHYFVESR